MMGIGIEIWLIVFFSPLMQLWFLTFLAGGVGEGMRLVGSLDLKGWFSVKCVFILWLFTEGRHCATQSLIFLFFLLTNLFGGKCGVQGCLPKSSYRCGRLLLTPSLLSAISPKEEPLHILCLFYIFWVCGCLLTWSSSFGVKVVGEYGVVGVDVSPGSGSSIGMHPEWTH